MADPHTSDAHLAFSSAATLTVALDLDATARRIGRYAWVEMQLFEAVGGWVATVPEAEVKLRLASHCDMCAWHADLWRSRLPELASIDPGVVAVPGSGALIDFMRSLLAPDGPDRTIERLVGIYRVLLPRLISTYADHLNRTVEVLDAPTVRILRLILRDHRDAWGEGESLLHGVIRSAEDAARASAHQQRLETIIVEAGGLAAGLLELGRSSGG